ncbi:MAG: FAD-dependent oxidoreductase [Thermoanaerobaculia bacterium]|nr:FAD-dependent oxidoreductase [Thermoanaerobaculia bacterium]
MQEAFDVIVIGGGTAGLVTASGCARLGRRVALIERVALGGDCLWTGCVPTKTLVASAKLAHQMRHAGDWGIDPHEPGITPRSVMESMRRQRAITAKHDDPAKFRALGIDVIDGDARLVSRNEVEVSGRRLTARDIVIATGSRTAVPPIDGLAGCGYLDHASFLDTDDFPHSVVILGGGAIGIEFAQIFRRLGSEVTVVEMADDILNKEDPDVIAATRALLTWEGITIRTGCRVTSVRSNAATKIVSIDTGGATEEIHATAVFVASGRRGNIENLGLQTAGVRTSRSYIEVDRFLQTSVPRIWACGDVHGGLQFTHVAAYEAVKLVRNMLFPGRSHVDYTHIPWTIYTDPEIARIGMTEPEAVTALGAENVKTYRVEMADVDRAVTDRATTGFIKIICDRKGRIAGAHVMATSASTLIATIVLARKKGAKIGELAQLVTPYPSFADALGKVAAQHYQELSGSWIGTLAKRIARWSQ